MAIAAATRVLTIKGWRSLRAVRQGDLLFDDRARTHRVTRAALRHTELVRVVFNDGASVECSLEQLWPLRTSMDAWRGKGYRVISLSSAVERDLTRATTESCRWFLPSVSPVVKLNSNYELRLPLQPYLLGVYLGDGGNRAGSGATPYLTNEDPFILTEANRLLPTGFSLRPTRDPLTYAMSSGSRGGVRPPNRVTEALKQLGLARLRSEDKFVPPAYLHAGLTSRLALLRGLCDTDGSVQENDSAAEFTTSSPRLAQDVRYLAESFGGTARSASRIPFYTHRGERRQGLLSYRVWVKLPAPLNPFLTPSKSGAYTPPSKYPPRRGIEEVLPLGRGPVIDLELEGSRTYILERFLLAHVDGDWEAASFNGAERLQIDPLSPPESLV